MISKQEAENILKPFHKSLIIGNNCLSEPDDEKSIQRPLISYFMSLKINFSP